MAKEAYYFSHDSNACVDPKILNMRYDYKLEGYGMYWVIVEKMREEEQYALEYKQSTFRALAMHMQCDIEHVQKFVDDCIDIYELFSKNDTHFYSLSLLKRMDTKNTIVRTRKRAAYIKSNKQKSERGEEQLTEQEIEQLINNSTTDAMHMHTLCNAIKGNKGNKGNKGKENTPKSEPSDKFPNDSMEYQALQYLIDAMIEYNPDRKIKLDKINTQTWCMHIDKLFRLDKVSKEDYKKIVSSIFKGGKLDWWAKNIQSSEKLREQWTRMAEQENEQLKDNNYNNQNQEYGEPDNPGAIPPATPEEIEEMRREWDHL